MQGERGAALEPATATFRGVSTLYLLVPAVLVLIADQVSKVIAVSQLSDRTPVDLVPHVLDLTLTRNSGAAFSLGESSTLLLSVISLCVIGAIVRVSRRVSTRAWALALGGVAGGAAGNLCDRLVRDPGAGRGHVVDWIHLHHWPIFNIADSAIVISGIVLVWLSGRGTTATVHR